MHRDTVYGSVFIVIFGALAFAILSAVLHGPRPPTPQPERPAPLSAIRPVDTGLPTSPITSTSNQPGASDRDAQRRADLQRLARALRDYRDKNGKYPDTRGNTQTACVFTTTDKLCVLRAQVGDQSFTDPRGDPVANGYWYASDGNSYILFATLEMPIPPEESCVPSDAGLARHPNLLCLKSP